MRIFLSRDVGDLREQHCGVGQHSRGVSLARSYRILEVCLEQNKHNREDVSGFHDHGRVGQHVVAHNDISVRSSVALGGSERRTKQFVME